MAEYVDLVSSDDEKTERPNPTRRGPRLKSGKSINDPVYIDDDLPPRAFQDIPPSPVELRKFQHVPETVNRPPATGKRTSPPVTWRSSSKRKQQPIQNPAAALRRQYSLAKDVAREIGPSDRREAIFKLLRISGEPLAKSIPARKNTETELLETSDHIPPEVSSDQETSDLEVLSSEAGPSEEVNFKPLSDANYISIFADLTSDEEDDGIQNEIQDDADSEIILKAEFFKDLVRDLFRQINEFQEYVNRPLLQQTRLDVRTRDHSTIPQPKTSPFNDLRSQNTATAAKEPLPRLHLQTKSYAPLAAGIKKQWNKITIPVTREKDVVPCLPRYKSINRPGISFLARSAKTAKHIPYAVEDENTDKDQLEEKYIEVGHQYYGYEENSGTLHAQRLCAEWVDLWRPWIPNFLKRIGLTTKDLAYYYCMKESGNVAWNASTHLTDEELAHWSQEQSTACLTCQFQHGLEKEKLWDTIGLAAPEPKSLAIAGLACSAFHHVTEFSIFCALIHSTELQAILRDFECRWNGPSSSQKMCLVCGLHQCSLHGAYIEDPDLPEAVKEAVKINDPEQSRNKRQLITLASRVPEEFQKQRGRKKLTLTHRKSKPEVLNTTNREIFIPCSHDGPCFNNPSCTCFKQNVSCEYFCGCDISCRRRFRGCKCHAGGENVCANDYSCECWANSRECDSWLCYGCGVLEVLDQANKYDEEMRKHRCSNNRLQLGIPARTIKGPSEVQGYGLFAGEALKKGEYIGEYTGEILNEPEADRRGALYHLLGAEYLFLLNSTQQIDATKFGSKTRFMNNSKTKTNINVAGCVMLCHGVQRVMLYADRDIKAGEEMLYDYGYPESISKTFWERGERPSNQRANIAEPVAKMATNAKKQQKFSLVQEEGMESSEGEVDAGQSQWEGIMRKTARVTGGLSELVTSDSEFSHKSEVDDSDVGDETAVSGDGRPRMNKRGVRDGRFGGSAQRNAAQTRAKKVAMGRSKKGV